MRVVSRLVRFGCLCARERVLRCRPISGSAGGRRCGYRRFFGKCRSSSDSGGLGAAGAEGGSSLPFPESVRNVQRGGCVRWLRPVVAVREGAYGPVMTVRTGSSAGFESGPLLLHPACSGSKRGVTPSSKVPARSFFRGGRMRFPAAHGRDGQSVFRTSVPHWPSSFRPPPRGSAP